MKTLHTCSTLDRVTHETTEPIKADVVFGSPAKRCNGIGICKVNPYDSYVSDMALPCCQKVSAQIVALTADQWEFRFSRRRICKKLISTQFAFSRFRIDDELLLPEWLSDHFGLPEVRLQRGAYPVVFEADSIRVRIRVR